VAVVAVAVVQDTVDVTAISTIRVDLTAVYARWKRPTG